MNRSTACLGVIPAALTILLHSPSHAVAQSVHYDVRPASGASSPVIVGAGGTVAYEVFVSVSDDGTNDGLLFFVFDLLTDLGVDQSADNVVFDPLIVDLFDFLGGPFAGIPTDDDLLSFSATQGFPFSAEPFIAQPGPQVIVSGVLQTDPVAEGTFTVTVANSITQLLKDDDGDDIPDRIIPDNEITTTFGAGFQIQVPMPDCNGNGVPDADDILGETSDDCNANSIPDECDPDCNQNQVPDECEDCDGDFVPDECEINGDCPTECCPTSEACGQSDDCNANGIPDECELGEPPAHDCCETGHGAGCSDSDVEACVCAGDAFCCSAEWDRLCSAEVEAFGCGLCGLANDCNGSLTPDECDVAFGSSADCNGNGTPDECDLAGGTGDDCNSNGIPDECDIASGTSNDCNANTFPDECDIASGTSQDGNANGVPDECAPVALQLDIKPGSCPNSFNRDSHGVLPVALLGDDELDVTEIDLTSIQLSRSDGVGGTVAPHQGPPGPHTVYNDVATPFDGESCECHTLAGDGFMDLSMKFRTDGVVAALELDTLPAGDLVELVVSGTLLDGTEFIASDCVRLVPPGTGPSMLTVNSNLPEAWIAIAPLDEQLDGGGFGQFDRTWPQSTVATLAAEEFYLGQRFVGWKFDGQFASRDMTADVTVIDENQTVDALFRRAGDITGDQAIDLNDFAMFAVCFGQRWGFNDQGACSNEALASSDLDRNGIIDLRDFATFALNFGT